MERDPELMYVSFSIWTEKYSPKELSEMLKIEPDDSKRIGDIVRGDLTSDTNFWEINSTNRESVHLSSHVDELMDRIRHATEILREISGDCKIWLNCAIYLREGETVPSIHLNKNTVRTLAKINAEFDVDIYLWD